MNPADRIRATIAFERVDRPPVAPELIACAATLCGVKAGDYVKSGRLIAQCQSAAAQMTGADAVFAAADLCVEAEALGCPLAFPEDNYPHVAEPVVRSIRDMERLSIPDPQSAARMPQVLEAVRLLAEDGGGRLVMGNAVGPITIASRIMDVEKMLYMIVDHPDQFRAVLAFCTQVSIRFVEAIAQAGAGGILLFDPSASPALLPPRIFREFVLEPVREIMAAVKKCNPSIVTWYSVAGPVQVNPLILSGVAAGVTTVDYPVPIQAAMEYSGHTVINGNIKPALFLEGTPDEVYREAAALLEETRLTERFILGSGCEIPLYSPLENILALRRAAEDHAGRAQIVNRKLDGERLVTFLPHGRAVYVPPGETILGAATLGGAYITTYCDLSGSCGECVVTVDSGEVSEPDRIEEAQLEGTGPGPRLSCMTRVRGDAVVYVPYSSRRLPDKALAPSQLLDESPALDRLTEYSPVFTLPPESQEKPAEADGGRPSRGGAACAQVSGAQLKKSWYGLALDMSGETAIVCVHDMATGELRHAGAFPGPVAALGLNNPGTAATPHLLAKLQEEITQLFNSIIGWLYECNSIMPERALGAVAACCPSSGEALLENAWAGENGWAKTTCGKIAMARLSDYPGLRIELMPAPDRATGGASRDAAFIMAALRRAPAGAALFVHIGSTGSATASRGGAFFHAPFPSGGVLERLSPRHSRRFLDGLIHKASIGPDGEPAFSILNGATPVGILGSAVAGLAAGLLRRGIIGPGGEFAPGQRSHVAGDRYVLAPKQKTAGYSPITVSEEDFVEVMAMARECRAACIRAMKAAGLDVDMVERVVVSGPFGVAQDPEDLATLGFFPDGLKAKAVFMLNGAGVGARMALLSSEARAHCARIASAMRPAGPA